MVTNLVGPRWVLRGCQVCGGDLYEEPDWPPLIAEVSDVFICLMCAREHTRRRGSKDLLDLGFDTTTPRPFRRRESKQRGIYLAGQLVFLADVPDEIKLVHQLASSVWSAKLAEQGATWSAFKSWPIVQDSELVGLVLCIMTDAGRLVAEVAVSEYDKPIHWASV